MEDRWSLARALLFAVATATLVSLVNAYQDQYSISQISPNSASDFEPELYISETGENFETSATYHQDILEIKPSASLDSLQSDDSGKDDLSHVRVERSAAPILRDLHKKSKSYDPLFSSNNVEESLDSNEVEVHHHKYYNQIQPTRTLHRASNAVNDMASSMTPRRNIEGSGEARGVPRGRALTPKGPQSIPIAMMPPMSATPLRYDSVGRQSNPDIQDIITGIVKLLNGNVNVQANTQPANGRPIRPPNTRINNRGPPRISDVPPLPPDFDTPGPGGPSQMMPPLPPQPSTKIPPPYPFDRPPSHEHTPVRPFINGIPIPEQIVPITNNQNYRPIRPQSIPPWQRPRPPRPPPINRRPNPNLPMYKPQPSAPPPTLTPYDGIDEAFTTIPKTDETLINHNMDVDDEEREEEAPTHNNVNEEINTTVSDSVTLKPITIINDGEGFVPARDPPTSTTTESTPITTVKEVEENTTTSTTPTPNVELHTIPTKQEVLKDSETVDKKKQTNIKAEKEKPINKKQEEKNKENETIIKNSIKLGEEDAINDPSTSVILEPTPILESSIIEPTKDNTTEFVTTEPVSISSTPTEALPEIKTTVKATSVIGSIVPTSIKTQPHNPTQQGFPHNPYKPRPGIVLDDTEYRPVGGQAPVSSVRRPKPPQRPAYGEIFDVTVSAIQGPNGGGSGLATVQIESVNPLTGQSEDIIVSPSGDQGFVSIDGKRTYLNLFGDSSTSTTVQPTPVQKSTVAVTGTGYVVPEVQEAPRPVRPQPSRPQSNSGGPPRRPQQPPVRIDTCIVGDDSTCDQTQYERCKTEFGISSCNCRPGYARHNHRDPCRKVVAMVFSLRVDRLYDRKIAWDDKLSNKESEPFQKLSFEAVKAVDSAFSMTPYSDEFVSGTVNTIYKGDPTKSGQGVYVNVTVLLEESSETLRGSAGADITRHLLGVIQRRSNNIGSSALWVERPTGSISRLHDLDECSTPELNDCHEIATCINVWGSFKCECPGDTRDAWAEQPNRAGRQCHTCPPSHCSNRGTCSYRGGQPVCSCTGAYYGSQCEVDGEVVGVAVGASLAALVVILMTLACLVMWSRRWSREQKNAAGMGSPVFGYMNTGMKNPNLGQSPYQVTLEERMRWAQLADVMAQANHYAQPEPTHPGARPPSAMYGAYPTLSMAGTLPPVPLPRMGLHMGSTMHLVQQDNNTNTPSRANTLSGLGNAFSGFSGMSNNHGTESTSSESDSHAQDRADLLGSRSFHVPRPKSRSNATNSIANQSGIYYDVDYENAPDPIYGTKGIPLSTYTMNRGMPFYRQ